MGKWDDLTEFEMSQLYQYRYWVTQQEVCKVAKQVVITAVDGMIAELKKRPRPPPFNGNPKLTEAELMEYKQGLGETDMHLYFKDVLGLLIDEVIRDLR